MYAVLARPVGGVFELGIFAAYDFTYDEVEEVFNKATQISFDNSWPYLNFFTLTQSFDPNDAGFSGAAPVEGFGSVNGSGIFSLSDVTTTAVPEPSSASLMLVGTVALFALRRLRNKNL